MTIELIFFSLAEKKIYLQFSNKKQNGKLPTDSGKVHHHSRDHNGELRVQIEHIRAHRWVGSLPSTFQFSDTK
jgi:hypothetical protein